MWHQRWTFLCLVGTIHAMHGCYNNCCGEYSREEKASQVWYLKSQHLLTMLCVLTKKMAVWISVRPCSIAKIRPTLRMGMKNSRKCCLTTCPSHVDHASPCTSMLMQIMQVTWLLATWGLASWSSWIKLRCIGIWGIKVVRKWAWLELNSVPWRLQPSMFEASDTNCT